MLLTLMGSMIVLATVWYVNKRYNESTRLNAAPTPTPTSHNDVLTTNTKRNAPIYCIMVTGKDEARIAYARKAVQNFNDQTYQNKYLVIVNHHPSLSVLDTRTHTTNTSQSNTLEVRVAKTPETTLGDIRNISLQFVSIDAMWTIWDDDDYRAPEYLSYLMSHATTPQTLVCFTSRLEVNINTKTQWVAYHKNGFATFLAPWDGRVKYLSKDTMEDVNMVKDYRALGYTINVIDNPTQLYVRLVHYNNTSLYVDKNKNYVLNTSAASLYQERDVTPQEREYIRKIMSVYYKSAL